MVAVDGLGLLLVPAGRVRVHVPHVERLDQVLGLEDVEVRADRPAEQGQIVDHPLADEAPLAVQEQVGLRVTLRQLLAALAQHERQVREGGHALGHADLDQGPVERDLTRRRGEQVLAADDVGDPHHRVVDRVDQGVERLPVAAHDDEVRHRACAEGHLATDEVGEGDVLVGHPQPQHRLTALGTEGGQLLRREAAVGVVVTELGVAAGRSVPGLDLVGGGVGLVGQPRLQEPARHIDVQLVPLALAVRAVRPAYSRTLVVVEPEPVEGLHELLGGLARVTRRVRVLDAEDEGATVVSREGPVEQRGAGHSYVRRPGGAGAEPDAHVGAGGLGVLGD
jgi:hypothetical protein